MRRREVQPGKEHGPHTLRVWRGCVVGVHGDDVFVELGPRMQGVISAREFDSPPAENDCFDFTLRGKEADLWALARAPTRALSSWEEMEEGSLVSARVLRGVPGGLQLKIGPLHAFLPRGQTGLARNAKPEVLVGRTLTCEVTEVDPERQRVIVSRKIVQKRERESRAQRQASQITPGRVVHGHVTRVEDYGVFVRFGQGMEGLIHVSNLSHERVGHPGDVLREGDAVEAKVLHVRRSGKRIGLGLKQMHESPWRDVERSGYVGQIVVARVARLAPFGAFLELCPGVEGLLPNGETGSADRPARNLLEVGQELSARIVALDVEEERMTLSLVHESGRPIAPDEAAAREDYERFSAEGDEAAAETTLGRLLREVLGRDEPRP